MDCVMPKNSHWGTLPADEALRQRLAAFMPAVKNPRKNRLVDYLARTYPFLGVRGVGKWNGLNLFGFPLLITRDAVYTEAYFRAFSPDFNPTVLPETLGAGTWRMPDDWHIHLWTPQPQRKGELPIYRSDDTIAAFQQAGLKQFIFENAVLTKENRVHIPKAIGDFSMSKWLFAQIENAVLSDDPYLLIVPERKSSRMAATVQWARSIFGVAVDGAFHKLSLDDLQAQIAFADYEQDHPDAIWIWKLREWIKLARYNTDAPVFSTLYYQLLNSQKAVVTHIAETKDKKTSIIVKNMMKNYMKEMFENNYGEVESRMKEMADDKDLSFLLAAADAMPINENGWNVFF